MAEDERQLAQEALRSRLDSLTRSLDARRAQDAAAEQAKAADAGSMAEAGRAMSLGFRAITELIVGLGLGTALGWGVDQLAGTAPLFMILLLFLGMAAGVWNVIRLANTMNTAGASALAPPTRTNSRDAGSNRPPEAG